MQAASAEWTAVHLDHPLCCKPAALGCWTHSVVSSTQLRPEPGTNIVSDYQPMQNNTRANDNFDGCKIKERLQHCAQKRGSGRGRGEEVALVEEGVGRVAVRQVDVG